MSAKAKISKINDRLLEGSKKLDDEVNIDDLFERVKKDLFLDELNLLEAGYKNTEHHHTYITLMFQCKRRLSTYRKYEKVLKSLLYTYYREETDQILRTKQDIWRHIEADDTMLLLQDIIDRLDEVIKYLEHVDRLFNERGFSINALSRMFSQ